MLALVAQIYRWSPDPLNKWVALLALPAAFTALGITMLLLCIIFKWLVIGRYRERTTPIWRGYYLRWWLVKAFLKPTQWLVLPCLRQTCILNHFYRALGAKIGRNVVINTLFVGEFDLLTIEDNVTVEMDAILFCAELRAAAQEGQMGKLLLKPISIGKGSTIGARSTVAPGAVLCGATAIPPMTSSRDGDLAGRPDSGTTASKPINSFLAFIGVIIIMTFQGMTAMPGLCLVVQLWTSISGAPDVDFVLTRLFHCLWKDDPLNDSGVCVPALKSTLSVAAFFPGVLILAALSHLAIVVLYKWAVIGRFSQQRSRQRPELLLSVSVQALVGQSPLPYGWSAHWQHAPDAHVHAVAWSKGGVQGLATR